MANVEDVSLWWQPDPAKVEASNLTKLRKLINRTYNVDLQTYEDVQAFSVDRLEDFWKTFWQFSGIRVHRAPTRVLSDPTAKPADLPRFFDDAQMNLAENLLYPLNPRNGSACMPNAPKQWPHDGQVAIYEWGEALPSTSSTKEHGMAQEYGRTTWGDLRREVAILAAAFRHHGVQPGDRIAHISSNSSRPIVSFLACLAVGGVFSALATDAGSQAIYGRLSQVQPRLILCDDVAYYNGRTVNIVDRIADVCDQLVNNKRTVEGQTLEVICIPNARDPTRDRTVQWKSRQVACYTWQQYIERAGLRHDATGKDVPALTFASMLFNHPALIVFSSGTTGEPKSICHSAGGILLNSKKEGLLQYDFRGTEDTKFQLTTCGWIMWLSQTCTLLSGASIVTYDGSPIFPTPLVVPDILHRVGRVTSFGCSPRLLSELERVAQAAGIKRLYDRYPTPSLRMATSTGSPLNPANIRFFYNSMVQPTVQLMSISGGTDLAGCLVASACSIPVHGHLIGAKCIGIDLRIVDPITGEDCEASGQAGELMVAKPFPTQPLYFWGDAKDRTALHERYMDSYYRRYDDGPAKGWWNQGDFISRHRKVHAFEIHGRSDGVLNPSGVRFGSAEIYAVVESGAFNFVLDSVVVGQRRPGKDDDERVLLFVKCRPGETLTEARKKDLAQAIRKAYSARHVPKHIFQVRDIPVTVNGKKTELAVKAVVSGNTKFKPSTATANPEALEEYRQYADIEAFEGSSRPSKL